MNILILIFNILSVYNKSVFSTIAARESKCRLKINVEGEIRVAVSKMKPRVQDATVSKLTLPIKKYGFNIDCLWFIFQEMALFYKAVRLYNCFIQWGRVLDKFIYHVSGLQYRKAQYSCFYFLVLSLNQCVLK